MFVKIYPGDDGKSHFEHVDTKAWQTDWAIAQANGPINFRNREPGFFYDFHNESRRQYVITLSGVIDVGIGDGTTLRFGPGDVLFAEDLTGQGHSVRVMSDVSWTYVAIPPD